MRFDGGRKFWIWADFRRYLVEIVRTPASLLASLGEVIAMHGEKFSIHCTSYQDGCFGATADRHL